MRQWISEYSRILLLVIIFIEIGIRVAVFALFQLLLVREEVHAIARYIRVGQQIESRIEVLGNGRSHRVEDCAMFRLAW
jgi:hypothetical protein